ncbi:MAG: class I SAM-dependent methyltransferase [Anaerolineales bacterium]|nr:class I SAM-dependent methyltransferase [Anaerolineales bacterium]
MATKNFIPEKSGYWKRGYITYRRLWLDACLNAFLDETNGLVIDLAGKRKNKRGTFQPPVHQVDAWWYINLDPTAAPDIFSDVTRTPLKKQSVDYVICTEVLEHLPDPQACVDEIHRLLRNGGVGFVSVPFFYPIHADPFDFQRFTEDGLRRLFRDFTSVEVYRMGGYPGVVGLLLELGISGQEGNSIHKNFLRWAMKWISRWLCWYDLSTFGGESMPWQKFTTGYFLKVVR